MLHDPHPVDQLLGQISRSNAGSKSSVEFVGQIAGRIHRSNSLVELLDQIRRSNSWIKFLGQIVSHVTPSVTGVTCDVTTNARQSNAGNPWPAAGKPRRTHGLAYGQPENGLGRAGKRQRKSPRSEAWARVQLLRLIRRRNRLGTLRGL